MEFLAHSEEIRVFSEKLLNTQGIHPQKLLSTQRVNNIM